MSLCPICSKKLVETKALTLACPDPSQHSGDLVIGAAILECPLKKGAIWVYVTDGDRDGMPEIPAKVAKAPKPESPTDPAGFARFDPLDPGPHEVEIQFPKGLADNYYPPATTKIPGVPVRNGEITSVQFKLERIAPLKVSVEHPQNFPGKPDIQVLARQSQFNPAFQPIEGKDYVIFPKLRKHTYDVKLALTVEQQKLFRVEDLDTQPWSLDPYGANEVKFKVIPLKLVSLEVVSGAEDLTSGRYWCAADPVKKVRVKAVTDPDDRETWQKLRPNWKGAEADGDGNEALVPIKDTGDFEVKVSLDVPKSLTVEVYDLVNVTCPLPDDLTGGHWKTHVSNKVTRLKAITKPDEARVWEHLDWKVGTPTGPKNECDVDLKPVGVKPVKVSLGAKPPLEVNLHICQWPVLAVEEVVFSGGHTVNKDTTGDCDNQWRLGRAQLNVSDTLLDPAPLCYTRNTSPSILAKLRVTTPPTENETVKVRGTGQAGANRIIWTSGNIPVTPVGGVVQFPGAVAGSLPLPDEVDAYNPLIIDWEMTDHEGAWVSIGSTHHQIYATLGNPAGTPAYWTLLHYSCTGAAGATTDQEIVDGSFNLVRGRNLIRQRDSVALTYWGDQVAAGPVHNTALLLAQAGGHGHCGSWAHLLIDMWKVHGLNVGHKVNVTRAAVVQQFGTGPLGVGVQRGFLVRNWNFNPLTATSAADLTHARGATCTVGLHAPGQNSPTPPPAFFNHFVVFCTTDNRIYDPSYGTDFVDAAAWEPASISGLFSRSAAPNAGYSPVGGVRLLQFRDLVTNANL